MSIVVRFKPTGLTTAKYDATVRQLEDAGEFPADGCDFHICFGSDGDLRVSEVRDSREQLQAFGEVLMPVLAANGVELSGEPEIFEIHNTVKR